jgi:hypothetical protein
MSKSAVNQKGTQQMFWQFMPHVKQQHGGRAKMLYDFQFDCDRYEFLVPGM